jgi:hypothetical protein
MWWLVVVACKDVEPAPEELDELLHWVWQRYDEGTDEELAEALRNLDRAVDGASFSEGSDGSLTRLSAEEAEIVGVTDRDPQLAPGVFLVNRFGCGMGQLEEILSYPDQSELYEGVYTDYGRTFDEPREQWLSGESPRVDYDIEYTASVLGAAYTARSRGALRRVPELDAESTPFGAFVIQRSYMPEPGAFEDASSSKTMEQDYQLELYWSRGEEVLHAYGMWRQASYGSGIDMEDEGSQRILLNNLLSWDEDTASLCAEGRP